MHAGITHASTEPLLHLGCTPQVQALHVADGQPAAGAVAGCCLEL